MTYILFENTEEKYRFEAENIHGAVLKAFDLIGVDKSISYQIEGDRAIISLEHPTRNFVVLAAK
jgi:hypothetical protein